MPTKRNDISLILNMQDFANGAMQTPVTRIELPRYRTGVSMATYRRLIASGQDATTPLTAEHSDITLLNYQGNKLSWYRSGGYNEWSTRWGFFNPTGIQSFGGTNGNLPVNPPVAADNAAKAMALKYYNKEINEIFSPLASKLVAGEIKETISLILNPTKSLRRLYDAIYFRKASFDRLPEGDSKKKALADLWLEFRMGALPLIYDINAALSILEGIHKRHFVKSYGVSDSTIYRNADERSGTWTVTHSHDVEHRLKIEYHLKAGLTQELLSYHKGLKEYLDKDWSNTTDFAGTVYELTPFSWLLDYFINVGDIIGSLQNIQSKTNFAVSTRVCNYTEIRKWNDIVNGTVFTKQFSAKPIVYTERRKVDRMKLESVIPPLVFSLPVTPTQVANTVALFIQRML